METTEDLTALTDDELESRKVAIEIEQDKRARRAKIPGEVRKLAEQYEAVGGDRSALAAEINETV